MPEGPQGTGVLQEGLESPAGGTEALGLVLPRRIQGKTRVWRPTCILCPSRGAAAHPRVPPTQRYFKGHQVLGAAGCSPSQLPVSRHPSDAACVLPGAPAPALGRRLRPWLQGELSYSPVPLSGHVHSQSGLTDPRAHHPQGL